MATPRHLIDPIKANFRNKLNVQLCQIAETRDPNVWAPEAVIAAEELLADRAAGREREPTCAPVEEAPLPGRDSMAAGLMAGLSLLALPFGFMILPMNSDEDIEDVIAQDMPIAFGAEFAWLAVQSAETARVAAALNLGRKVEPDWRRKDISPASVREATWEQGLDAARRGEVFLTPPLGNWTLAVSTSLFPPAEAAGFVRPLLERLSREFEEAQYFCPSSDRGARAWAQAVQGVLVRGHCDWPDADRPVWSEGDIDELESELNLGQPDAERSADDVLALASFWSIDPSSLDMYFKEPKLGLLGSSPWA